MAQIVVHVSKIW